MNDALLCLLGPTTAKFVIFISNQLLVFTALALDEIIVLKCLYIYKWSRMALIDDAFMATVIGAINLIVSFSLSCLRLYLDDLECTIHYEILTMENRCIQTSIIRFARSM